MTAEDLRIEMAAKADKLLSRFLVRGRDRAILTAFRQYLPSMPAVELEKVLAYLPKSTRGK